MDRRITAISYSGKPPKRIIPISPMRHRTDEDLEQAVLYMKMYASLCTAISRSIDLLDLPENMPLAKSLLQQALWEAEELYISHKTGSES